MFGTFNSKNTHSVSALYREHMALNVFFILYDKDNVNVTIMLAGYSRKRIGIIITAKHGSLSFAFGSDDLFPL